MYRLERIISGGQTGVDRAALDFAIQTGIAHGGWCPQGRLAEDGCLPGHYRLRELPGGDYAARTRQNVIDSDATLVLNLGLLEGGTRLTVEYARAVGRPCLLAGLDSGIDESLCREIGDWLTAHRVRVLNVAGPRESQRPGVYRLTWRLFDAVGMAPVTP